MNCCYARYARSAAINRFHIAMHLSSNRSRRTSKCGKNISDTLGYRLVCHSFVLTTFWRHLWSITGQMQGNMESICQVEGNIINPFIYNFSFLLARSILKLNQAAADSYYPIIPIGIVAYAFTLLFDSLCSEQLYGPIWTNWAKTTANLVKLWDKHIK